MEATVLENPPGVQHVNFVNASDKNGKIVLSHVKSCWYCSRPLFDRRTFCSSECREALYEDNEQAQQRRMILGCRC